MPAVRFLPAGVEAQAAPGAQLLEVARLAGVSIDATRGGEGSCGKCRVRLEAGQVDHDSLGVLGREEVAAGWVLACRARLGAEAAVIMLGRYPGEGDGAALRL